MQLRDFQLEAVRSIENKLDKERTALLSMATGTGKTETVFGFMQKNEDARILFAVNRVSLVEQTYRRAKAVLNPDLLGTYCGSLNTKSLPPITIASVQSLAKLKSLPDYEYIVFDEAHRINLTEGSQYSSIISRLPGAKIIGLTATPFRDTGFIYGDGKLFKDIAFERNIEWAIKNGWLVPPRLKHVEAAFDTSSLRTRMGDYAIEDVRNLTSKEATVREQVMDAMGRIVDRHKIIWHAASIEHAEMIQRFIPEPSAILHSRMSKQDREKNQFLFERTHVRHLIFVMVVSEGYDFPAIDSVILMRPTKSAVTYVQVIGRSLRLYPGKKDSLILDYGSVIASCGPLNEPNVPQGRGIKSVPIPMKFCPKCYEYVALATAECPACGHDFIAAKLAAQRDRLASLTLKPDTESALFKTEAKEPEWVEINAFATKAEPYLSKTGNKCVRFCFRKKDSVYKTFYKYLVVEGSNPYTLQKSRELIARITRHHLSFNTAEEFAHKINEIGFSHLAAIKVDLRGKWPDIVGYKYVNL